MESLSKQQWTALAPSTDTLHTLRSTRWQQPTENHFSMDGFSLWLWISAPLLAMVSTHQKSAQTPKNEHVEKALNALGIGYMVEYPKDSNQAFLTVCGENYDKLSQALGYDPLSEKKGAAR